MIAKGEAQSLDNLREVYRSLGQDQRPIEFYQQSIAIYRQIGDPHLEALSSPVFNSMDFASGDQRGIKLAQQFLAVFRQTGNRRGEATSLSLLALFLEFQQKQTDLAIIHLKQAVNIYEAIRGDIKGLDKETQRSFVGKEEVVFTYLYAPDKQLRYIPLTALYDGKQWLIEKYQTIWQTSTLHPAVVPAHWQGHWAIKKWQGWLLCLRPLPKWKPSDALCPIHKP